MNYAIVGCGLIGRKRLASLPKGSRLVVACDLQRSRAEDLARGVPGARATADFMEAVAAADVEVVIVATLNGSLADVAGAAIRAGKHVLVEKPAARNVTEARQLVDLEAAHGVMVRVGYNHRYHPALQKARALIDEGIAGELMFMRGRYGHGGRVGYDREWRADPALSGGGELIDQGVHLIDLARWFFGELPQVEGHAVTSFWDMPVDDNAFMNLRTADGRTAWLHVSCSEWKNLFSLEIYGRGAKLEISGLGGSYGIERLTLFKMLPEMGPPETTIWEYPRGDQSWRVEMEIFEEDICLHRRPDPGLRDALAILEIVGKIYENSPTVRTA